MASVKNALKNKGYKRYLPQVIQLLKEADKAACIKFAQALLKEINAAPWFLDMDIFSDKGPSHLLSRREHQQAKQQFLESRESALGG